MAVKGIKDVNRRFAKLTGRIAGPMTNRAMTEIIIIGEGYAAELTPVDTSNLINSRYRQVTNTATGTKGIVGYTANYALWVHEGGPKNWKKSAASDQFLSKGFENANTEIQAHLRRRYRM